MPSNINLPRHLRIQDHLDEEVLCCCQYINMQGERAHIVQMCCDCAVFDDVCERIICCRNVPTERFMALAKEIDDRVRIPGMFGGGAKKVPWTYVLPILIMLLTTYVGMQSFRMTVFSMLATPALLVLIYTLYLKHLKNRRTPFFFIWAFGSTIEMWIWFQLSVFTTREILLLENLVLTTSMIIMLLFLYWAKQDPGIIKSPRRHKFKASDVGVPSERESEESLNPHAQRRYLQQEVTWIDSRPFKDGHLLTYCESCGVHKPARSGHCSICQACIQLRDHHCVWIDSCVGERNHRWFVLALCLYVCTGFYGAHLALTAVCTPRLLFGYFLYPSDCRFIYNNALMSLAYSKALYTIIVSSGMLMIFLQQAILISQNATSQEAYQASRRGLTKYFFFIRNNVNNHGFWRNWRDFFNERRVKTYVDSKNIP